MRCQGCKKIGLLRTILIAAMNNSSKDERRRVADANVQDDAARNDGVGPALGLFGRRIAPLGMDVDGRVDRRQDLGIDTVPHKLKVTVGRDK